jgi:tetratricopeptide (TPR) repeat protein
MRLADASTAVQLWNQEFRPAAIPEFRDLVVGRVAETLGLQLIRAEARQGYPNRPVPPQTVELMSQARAVLPGPGQGTAGALQARSLLEDSGRHDDRSAETWAMLATTYLNNVRFSASREFEIERAGQAVQRALALAPDSDAVRLAEGRLYYEQKRMPQALLAFERATELNPNNAPAHAWRAAALTGLGRPDESLAAINQAIRLSPRDKQLWLWHLITGVAHLHLRHDEAAVEWLARSVKVDSRSPFGRLYLAGALGVSGRIPEAQAQMAELQRVLPGVTLSRIRATEPSDAPAFRKQRERLYEGLRRAGMPE